MSATGHVGRQLSASCSQSADRLNILASSRWFDLSGARSSINARILLLARIYEVLPLLCPRCGGEMRIIGFITAAVAIREILGHLGEPTSPPRLAQARGPPLWAMLPDAARDALDPQAQPAPEYEFDQRIAW